MNSPSSPHVDLQAAAQRVMVENGFEPDVPPGVAQQLAALARHLPLVAPGPDAFVPKDSAIDQSAARQTTTVYTGVRNFPMLPEQLSTATTSLGEAADKLAVVIEFVVGTNGQIASSTVYRAVVRNIAQLTYNAVKAWLEGRAPAPSKVAASPDLQSQLRLQDGAAVMLNDQVVSFENQEKNRATELIEDFMIASNEVVARLWTRARSRRSGGW